MPEILKINVPDIKEINIEDVISKSEIKYSDEIKRNPSCIEIKEGVRLYRYATYGNFGAIIGKQKSRKTFYYTMPMASAINDGLIFEKFMAHTYHRTNIIFDTEQSSFDVQKVLTRCIRISENNEQPNNFKVYGLKSYSPEERILIIDHVLNNTKNPGYIIIDGIRDLVYDINDAKEGTEITTKLMKWVEILNCHIDVVLHVNKGDENPRGHLGTEIQNKAESVIIIEKHKENKELSIVRPRDFRGIEFTPFVFMIENGLPVIVNGSDYGVDTQKEDEF